MADLFAGRPAGPLSALGLSVAGATVIVDQGAKWLAEARLPMAEAIEVLPVLDLYRVHNDGIAFSLFSSAGGLPLIVMTLAISLVVLAFWWRARDGGLLAALGFALIVGGAIGNLIDRLVHGYVIDFLLLHVGGWVLFVFNLADAALTVGPVLLLLTYAWPRSAPATGDG